VTIVLISPPRQDSVLESLLHARLLTGVLSSTDLRPFSYAVLVLVGRHGAGPHDLVRMMRAQGDLYWAAAESHWYAEPKRLERLGYLRSRKEPGRTTERTEYELTKKGLAALRDWLKRPSPFPRIQDEAVVRVLAVDLGKDEDVLGSLAALETEIAVRRGLLEEALERAKTLPHRERQLRLVHRLGSLLLDAHEQWLADVRKELSPSA
jgi:DNA-binding PadR family transcriptional regulator